MANCFTHTYDGKELPAIGKKYVPAVFEPSKTSRREAQALASVNRAQQLVLRNSKRGPAPDKIRRASI